MVITLKTRNRNNIRFPLLQSLTLALHLVGFLKMGEVLTLTL
jgi:hypothetical protein